MDENLFTISQTAKLLNVSIDTLRRWESKGILKSHRKPKGMRYYSENDIEEYLKSVDIFKFAFDWASKKDGTEPPKYFYCPNSSIFQARLTKLEFYLNNNKAKIVTAPFSLIVAITGEIGNNSFDHNLGNWIDISGIFFAFDLENRKIALADRGRGILNTLKRVRPELKDDEQALKVAFTEVISGRAPESRGNGLKFVKRIVYGNDIKLQFQSGDAKLKIKKGDIELKIKRSDKRINGCIALIEY